MAVGKNKALNKKKKGNKKIIDPFTRKEWYDLKAPAYFKNRTFGKTLVTRTTGTKIASESLKERVYEISLGDLMGDEDRAFRKMRLRCEEVQGRNCLTNFYGMNFTTDKLKSLIKKGFTLIEANVDAKTTDGYILRVFCIGFTARAKNQVRRTSYAQGSQVRRIRQKMIEIMSNEITSGDLRQFVTKLIPDSIASDIEKACKNIYPLQNVFIRKVKLIKSPKFDLVRLMELYGDSAEDTGKTVEKPAVVDATPLPGSGGRL